MNLSQEQNKFNRLLSSAKVAVERAFGILKARWRCLLNCLDHNIENLSDVIISCCVLHNICQMKGDSYIDNDDVLEHTLQRERGRTQRRQEREFHASVNTLRDILTDYVNADNWKMLWLCLAIWFKPFIKSYKWWLIHRIQINLMHSS